MNLRLGPQLQGETFTKAQILAHQDPLNANYKFNLDRSLVLGIGPILPRDEIERRIVGMPAELGQKLALNVHNDQPGKSLMAQFANPRRNDELFAKWQQKGRELGWGPLKTESYFMAMKQFKKVDHFMGKWKSRVHQGIKRLGMIKDSLNELIQGERQQRMSLMEHARHKLDQQQQLIRLSRNSIQQLIHGNESQPIITPRQSKDKGQTHSH